ncbi:ubiquitin carboxyl-terminal hydrolase isozyme L5 isoform X1 [Petromyzon marinus]|uniref:Ubiquitin carboxyl-terminal hydrolase n=1 Tax=Petromyzon marinus TaxID=7757 RepID=A0AAJ7WN32_PETMA|nr:ubiquitin carboxyl-terminal hydrolase isozyme L5 isoform X1 [Petromyzon marinus]
MADRSAGEWCLIESDPGVFTELIRGFGCKGAQVEEIYSLEEESFSKLKPVHGLIFLFKWTAGEEMEGSIVRDSRNDTLFFAKQVISNACATQALLSVLLNVTHSDVTLGHTLTSFRDFTSGFDSAMKGLALSNSDTIRQVHNSFARQQMFEWDGRAAGKDEDAFHFVAFVPKQGRLYELDGLRDGPIDLGACDQEDWVKSVRPVIERRIQRYTEGEIRFSLMAVVSDRRMIYERRIAELQAGLTQGEAREGGGARSLAETSELMLLIEEENLKMQQHKVENVRRKHNYLPFIMELLKTLAEQQQLLPLVEKAKEKAAARKVKEAK